MLCLYIPIPTFLYLIFSITSPVFGSAIDSYRNLGDCYSEYMVTLLLVPVAVLELYRRKTKMCIRDRLYIGIYALSIYSHPHFSISYL